MLGTYITTARVGFRDVEEIRCATNTRQGSNHGQSEGHQDGAHYARMP